VLFELALDAIHEGIGLLAGQRADHVAHDLGVGVHAGKRLPVTRSPAAQDQALGSELQPLISSVAGHQVLQRVAAAVLQTARQDRVTLVAVDGVDGAGKSTFGDELAAQLRGSGRPVIRRNLLSNRGAAMTSASAARRATKRPISRTHSSAFVIHTSAASDLKVF